MCDLNHVHSHDDGQFGFLVDTPEVRALIEETRRQMSATTDSAARVEALKPTFARLLAADGWLPDDYARPDEKSRMGDGIGQYALYRAEDGSLCLFSLVVPSDAETPVCALVCGPRFPLPPCTSQESPSTPIGSSTRSCNTSLISRPVIW
jgi:hypothetical protein